jgi:hypothetical protein
MRASSRPSTRPPTNDGGLDWSLVVAVNNQTLLEGCLLHSPDAVSATEVMLQKGYGNAAEAYNRAIDRARTDIVVFVHQDVYLPGSWLAALKKSLAVLSQHDPRWAVLGVWGVTRDGHEVGHVYCAGVQRTLGGEFTGIKEVQSLDELLLVVRKSSGVRFDVRLNGFHLYGTDICLEAKARGMKSYAISAFCLHNTNGYRMLPLDFWKAYFFLRRKWASELPITTPCTKITRWCWPVIRWNLNRAANLLLGRHQSGKRVSDPVRLYRELVAAEKVQPVSGGD